MANTLNVGNGDWATKENSLLGYNSENGNYKPLPFDFTRASNGTFVNKSGLIETAANGVPRIDFLGNTSGALLLEPQRTNLITYSSDFIDASWVKANATITSNYSTSIFGTNTSFLLTSTSAIAAKINKAISSSNNTQTYFVKKGNHNFVQILDFGSVEMYANFDLNNGVVGSFGSSSTAYIKELSNGWYKISCYFTGTTSRTNLYISESNTSVYGGGNIPIGATIEISAAQLEQGRYATSLINTQGSAVTRVADFAEQDLPNDNILIDNNSTIYFEIDTTNLVNNTPNTGGFNFKNSGGTLQLNFNYGYGRIYSNYYSGSTTAIVQPAEVGRYKIAFPLTNGSYLYVNGVQKSATSRDWSSISISEIEILFGHSIIDFKLYNTVLTDAELIALTTI